MTTLKEYFAPLQDKAEVKELFGLLIIYANQLNNYYQNLEDGEEKNELKEKMNQYELKFLIEYKHEFLQLCHSWMINPFLNNCNIIENRDDFKDFFTVLDWIQENYPGREECHRYEGLLREVEFGSELIYDFANHATNKLFRELEGGDTSELIEYIDVKRWTEDLRTEYSEIENPLYKNNFLYSFAC